jgi:hypothetical protein
MIEYLLRLCCLYLVLQKRLDFDTAQEPHVPQKTNPPRSSRKGGDSARLLFSYYDDIALLLKSRARHTRLGKSVGIKRISIKLHYQQRGRDQPCRALFVRRELLMSPSRLTTCTWSRTGVADSGKASFARSRPLQPRPPVSTRALPGNMTGVDDLCCYSTLLCQS